MTKRMKLLTDNILNLKCNRCETLLLRDFRKSLAEPECAWKRIVDADLRQRQNHPWKKMARNPDLLCKKCLTDPGVDFSMLTEEQFKEFERMIGILLGYKVDFKVNEQQVWTALTRRCSLSPRLS
jgi:hypothetical protein